MGYAKKRPVEEIKLESTSMILENFRLAVFIEQVPLVDVGAILLSLASSAVVAALISGFVSLRTSSRNIKVENVTKQREAWRDKVRCKALQVHQLAIARQEVRLAELHLEFTLILNPVDNEDRKILELIRELSSKNDAGLLEEFADRVALLLKHDWERAKLEAGSALLRMFRRCRRISYEEFKKRAVISSK